jgi:hypothetical protein
MESRQYFCHIHIVLPIAQFERNQHNGNEKLMPVDSQQEQVHRPAPASFTRHHPQTKQAPQTIDARESFISMLLLAANASGAKRKAVIE